MSRKLLRILLVLLTTLPLFMSANTVKIKVKGQENQEMILAYHYGKKQFVQDTFQFNNKGILTFDASEKAPGIYMAVFPNMGNKYFELILGNEDIDLEPARADFTGKMKINASLENELFYGDMRFLGSRRKASIDLKKERDRLKSEEGKADSVELLNGMLKTIDEEVIAHRAKIVEDNPQTFYATLLTLMDDVEIPEELADSLKYHYYITHYWDDIDFSHRGIVRTPIYIDKLENWHTKILPQIPDTLKIYFDDLLDKTLADSFVFQYTIVHLLNHYAKSKIMGMDAMYVHLVQEYYTDSTKVWWTNWEQRFKIVDEAGRLAPLLIGEPAPNLILADSSLRNYYDLHKEDNKYKIVYIWDPDCGHCKKATPLLQKEYVKFAEDSLDVGVYAVSTVSYEEIDKWKQFIIDNGLEFINVADPYYQHKPNFRDLYDISSTPSIWLLDADNRIIAKRLSVEQIANYIRRKEGLITGPDKPLEISDPEPGSEDKGGDKSAGPH